MHWRMGHRYVTGLCKEPAWLLLEALAVCGSCWFCACLPLQEAPCRGASMLGWHWSFSAAFFFFPALTFCPVKEAVLAPDLCSLWCWDWAHELRPGLWIFGVWEVTLFYTCGWCCRWAEAGRGAEGGPVFTVTSQIMSWVHWNPSSFPWRAGPERNRWVL